METSPPAVLIEDLEGASRAIGRRFVLKEWLLLRPTRMLMIPADRELNQCWGQVVSDISPIQAGMTH